LSLQLCPFFLYVADIGYITIMWDYIYFLCLHINDPGDSEFCLQFYGHLNTAGPPIPQLK